MLLSLGVHPSHATLGKSTLTELIRDSDVIARATVTKSELRGNSGGLATFRVEVIYKGLLDGNILHLEWAGEAEEQRLECVDKEYLLFLRRSAEGVLEGTHVGRSYWPLNTIFRSTRLVTPYIFPMTFVVLERPDLMTRVPLYIDELPKSGNPVEMDAIPLDRLVPAIREVTGNPR